MYNLRKLVKLVYDMLPLKQKLFVLVRAIYKPSQKFYQHLHFKGFFIVKLDAKHQFLLMHNGSKFENDIFWRGLKSAWERQSLSIWNRMSRNSSIILDVGANTGVYSLVASALNPRAKIYAFEPLTRMSDILKKNVAKNNFSIYCIEAAVSDCQKKAVIYDRPFEVFRQASLNPDYGSNSQDVIQVEVNCISLDHFMCTHKIERVDLVKIDVESHEFEVLVGFKDGLIKYKPVILIEILNGELVKKIASFLNEFGYSMYTIDEEKGLILKSKPVSSQNRNFLCFPQDRTHEIISLLNENVFYK